MAKNSKSSRKKSNLDKSKRIKSKGHIKSYDLSFKDLSKMTQKERHAYYTKLRAIAEKRLARLAGAGFTDSSAYRDFRDAFPRLNRTAMSESDVAATIKQMQDFINRPDSTVRGQRNEMKKALDAIKTNAPEEEREYPVYDENGNPVYKREPFTDKLGRTRTRFVRDEYGNKVPLTEKKMRNAYDWITNENAREVFRFIDMVRKRAGSRLIYDPVELEELWNIYKDSKNQGMREVKRGKRTYYRFNNKAVEAAFKAFYGSSHTKHIVSDDPRVKADTDRIKQGKAISKSEAAKQKAKQDISEISKKWNDQKKRKK